eukprot:4636804-Pleurochrysis_carterae.AAC.1
MSCPTDELMAAAQRVLMYLSRHRTVGLRFSKAQLPATISWASKKQPFVALSSCEAEIIAASEATKEAVYLRSLFADLGLSAKEPTTLGLDNKSAIDLAYNPEHHQQRSKHIDRRHFFACANASSLTTSRSPSSTVQTIWLISSRSRYHRGCSLRCATSL